MKKWVILLCAFVCILSLSACGQEQSISEEEENILKLQTSVMLFYAENGLIDSEYEMFMNYSEFEWMLEIDQLKSNYNIILEEETIKDAMESYRSAVEEVGAFDTVFGETQADIDAFVNFIDTAELSVVDESYEVSLPLLGDTGRAAKFLLTVDESFEVTACQTDVEYTLGEKMSSAGINTLIGMGTVFSVLIVISLIISCFRFIPYLEERSKKKKAGNTKMSIDTVFSQIAEKEDEELTDDKELVAVIAAAVAAYEGQESPDGFSVRSIRKANVSKWKNV